MSTYLSLDLDFFNAAGRGKPRFLDLVEQNLERVGEFIRARGVPAVAVMNHQQMLRFVDASGCNRLLNVDTHSDLAETDVDEFCCGTWVSYVKWRKTGSYVWHHGYSAGRGDCSARDVLFKPRSPYNRGERSGWESVFHIRRLGMPPLTEDITSVGVCLSPSYVDFPDESAELLREWTKKYNVPYVRGRKDEHFGVTRRPPAS